MHYCIHLFTEELPNEAQINTILEPFKSENVYHDDGSPVIYPAFTWDYFLIGGRYGGALKLRVDLEADDEYCWKYYARPGEQREGRLFHSSILREIRERFKYYDTREENWIGYMGDGSFIFVDGAKVKDLINPEELGSFGFVDIDGTAYSRSQWNGERHIDHDDYDERYQKTLKARSDCFLTVLDIHD